MSSGVVYILDDEAQSRPDAFEYFSGKGLTVHLCGSIGRLLECYEPGEPACLLVVDSSSILDSGKVRRSVVADVFELPVIVVTRQGAVDSAVQAMKSGAFHCLDGRPSAAELYEHILAALGVSARARSKSREREQARESISRFTPRERQVIHLVSEGLSTRDIADHLSRSTKTIEAHRRNLLQKAGAHSLAEVVRLLVLAEGR